MNAAAPVFSLRFRMARLGALVRREVRDQFRDWRVVLPLAILTLFFPVLMNYAAHLVINYVNQYGGNVIAQAIFPFLLMIVGFFPTSVSLVIALESFVGEKERYSLEPLLATPLTDTELFLGKVLASVLTPLCAAGLGIAAYLAGMYFLAGWFPPLPLLFEILVLTVAHAACMVSAAVVISAQTNSVRAANLLASFVIVPAALLMQGESIVMFYRMYRELWWIIAGVFHPDGDLPAHRAAPIPARGAALARGGGNPLRPDGFLLLAVVHRRRAQSRRSGTARRSVPRCGGRSRRFPGRPSRSVSARWPGLYFAESFPFPAQFAANEQLPTEFLRFARRARVLHAGRNAGDFLSQRCRRSFLASILGAISLGIMGLVIMMLPIGIIAYATAILARGGFAPGLFLLGLVLPHGIVEIPAMALAGAAILRCGNCLLAKPEGRSLGQLWLQALADWLTDPARRGGADAAARGDSGDLGDAAGRRLGDGMVKLIVLGSSCLVSTEKRRPTQLLCLGRAARIAHRLRSFSARPAGSARDRPRRDRRYLHHAFPSRSRRGIARIPDGACVAETPQTDPDSRRASGRWPGSGR